MLIDTHCHLYFDSFDNDRGDVIRAMTAAGVGGAVVIGIDKDSNGQAHRLAAENQNLRYSVGLHPTAAFEADYFADGRFDASAYLGEWLKGELKPVAIGECGIDLHWDTNPLDLQQQVFSAQLELSRKLGLPCIVHTRAADMETLEVLSSVEGTRGILHCFNGSPQLLEFALSAERRADWFVSFAGNLTFPKAQELREAAASVPPEQLLVETDAPFLAPQPVRGKRNEPAYCRHTALALAEIKGIGFDELAQTLTANSERCFATSWKQG